MQWERELNIACQAVKLAGETICNIKRSAILNSNGRDVKHLADTESEKIIIHALKALNSNYPIIAEETGEFGDIDGNSPKWIIDPLDGTVNFSRNIDYCCVSIALWDRNPILGVLYDFNREELFSGVVGQGAWLNEQSLQTSDIELPEQAILATGFPVNRDFTSTTLQEFLSQIKKFKKIRLLGSAALSLAYVASGRIDCYAEDDIMLWDVAAGIAIVKAAGGYVRNVYSSKLKWALKVRAGSAFQS